MNHRLGIVVSAVIGLLGSLALLLFAALVLGLPYIIPAKAGPFPPEARVGMYLAAAMFLLGAAWGISTSIGLFRRDRWARISILIFSFFLAATCLISTAVALAIPLPAAGKTDASTIRLVMAGFYGIFAALGMAWAIYFTRPGVKAEFGAPRVRTDPRPLSIVIIGWWLLTSSFFVLPNLLLRLPAYFLGTLLTGWAALAVYLLFGALGFYCGWGLLHLDPFTHKVAIGYLIFGAINGITIWLLPERLREYMQLMPAWSRPPAGVPQAPNGPILMVVMLAMLAVFAILLWFLITRRAAFSQPATNSAKMS